MSPFGSKPKRTCTRKTLKERMDDLADKALLDAMKHDEKVLNQYIKQRHGIDIPSTSERMISQVIEQAKLTVIRKVGDEISNDPEVQDAVRDKMVAELLGVPPHQPRAKEKGERSQRPNIQGQFEKMKATIQLANKYREFFGVNESIWSKVVQNPEFMKMAMGLIQGLMGPFGLPQATAAADGNGQTYFVLIDDQYVEMDHDAFVQHTSKKKVLESPAATPIKPDQKEATDKPVAASGSPKSWPPPIASPNKIPEPDKKEVQEVIAQPTSDQRNAGDDSKKTESGTTR
jgi:hypothetical protein